MITIPLYSQYDARWASKPLGTSGNTMRSHGCYVTSITMIVNNYGYKADPGQTCDALNAINGFTPDGDVKWEAVMRVFPNVVWEGRLSCWTTNFTLGANLAKVQQTEALRRLDKLVKRGMPTILCVDNVGNDKRPDHAIVLKNTAGRWLCNDPDGGIEVALEAGHKYGPKETAVYGLRAIIGPALTYPDGNTEDDNVLGLATWKASMVAAGKSVATYSKEIIDHLI